MLYPTTQTPPQNQVEADSRQTQQLLAAFFTQAPDGIFFMMLDEPVTWNDNVDQEAVLDYAFAHQRVTCVNPAALAQYQTTPAEFIGKTPNDLFASALAPARVLWRQLFGQGQLRIETAARRVDGTTMAIEGDYMCLYDAAGRITGHVGVQRDITERKQAEALLRESEAQTRQLRKAESLRRMAGAIAHHFNNRLQAVMGNIEMALLNLPEQSSLFPANT